MSKPTYRARQRTTGARVRVLALIVPSGALHAGAAVTLWTRVDRPS